MLDSKTQVNYKTATLFRTRLDVEYYEQKLRCELENSKVGKRINAILQKGSGGHSLNRFIAKNQFIYVLQAIASGRTLTSKQITAVDQLFIRYEVNRHGNKKPNVELAV